MKTTNTFKMCKLTKRMLSLFPFKSQESKNHFKKHMIMAQILAEQAIHSSNKNNKEPDTP